MRRFTAVVVTALVCGACSSQAVDYEGDPTANAIAAFTTVYGPPSAVCERQALDMEVTYMPIGDVQLRCKNPNANGCTDIFNVDGPHAYIDEAASPYVLAHETLHVLLSCADEWDDSDNHTGRAWALLAR